MSEQELIARLEETRAAFRREIDAAAQDIGRLRAEVARLQEDYGWLAVELTPPASGYPVGWEQRAKEAEARSAVLVQLAGAFVRAHRIISGRPCRCVYCQGFRAALRPASGAGTGTRPPPAGEEM